METEISLPKPQTPAPQIITDPQKLINQINRSGTVGIILGVLLIVIGLLLMVVSKSDTAVGAMVIYCFIGITYVILGFIIRNNPTGSKKVLQFTFWFSVVLAVIGLISSGKAPGILILLYIWILNDSIKFLKRLSAMQNSVASVSL